MASAHPSRREPPRERLSEVVHRDARRTQPLPPELDGDPGSGVGDGADEAAVDHSAHRDLTVVLTPMRRRHLRGVLRIEQQVYPRPWSLGLYLGELSNPAKRIYAVARVDTTVVGYAGMMLLGTDGHVTTVAVDPQWHRNHIASRLLLLLSRQAASRDIENLTLEVRASNRGAQEMYRRFGFAPGGVRRNYYVENNEDAIVMWAHDIGRADHAARLARVEGSLSGHTVVEGFPHV